MIYCTWIELLFVYGHHSAQSHKKGAHMPLQKKNGQLYAVGLIDRFTPSLQWNVRKQTTSVYFCGKIFGDDLLFDIQKFVIISILPNAS